MSTQQELLEFRRSIPPDENSILYGIATLVADACDSSNTPFEIHPIESLGVTVHSSDEKDVSLEGSIQGRLGAFAVTDRIINKVQKVKDITIQVVSPGLVEEVHGFGSVTLPGVAKLHLATIDPSAPDILQDTLNKERATLNLHDAPITLTPAE